MTTYESILGIFLVGTVVTNWPHNNVPTPKKRHHIHCSKVKLAVENAILPHWIIRTWMWSMAVKHSYNLNRDKLHLSSTMKSVYTLTYADGGPSNETVWKIHKKTGLK